MIVTENQSPLTQQDTNQGGAVKLTRPDGTPIYVNPRAIAFIRGPLPGEQGHTTVVFTSGAKQTVQESVQDIMDIWEAESMPKPAIEEQDNGGP
jgi:uncharacterized protein YlzI (FlbEa/FlbD family)